MRNYRILLSILILLVCNHPVSLPAQSLEFDYSTYLGGWGGWHWCEDIAVDSNNCAYVCGNTGSTEFPIINAYQTSMAGADEWAKGDVFVTKFSSSGSSLVYSTYLGGWTRDWPHGICIDSENNAYIAGYTWSDDFPIKNAYQSWRSQTDPYYSGFIAKLSSSGSSLVYSTYLEGKDKEREASCTGICVNSENQAYVTGWTSSSNTFPIVNAYQPWWNEHGGVFVTIFSSSGSSLIYSTFLGTNTSHRYSFGEDICLDSENCFYVTGRTGTTDFPVVNPYQSMLSSWADTTHPSDDMFVTKFTSSGSSLVYSTYLGGHIDGISDNECGYSICVDSNNCAYVIGATSSSVFPIVNAYQSTFPVPPEIDYRQALSVTKFSSSGSSLIYSTYLGGGYEFVHQVNSICVDSGNRLYVTGSTYSDDFPVLNAYSSLKQGESDAFITVFSSSGSSLAYSTYLGGDDYMGGIGQERGAGICLDSENRIYVFGETWSYNFPIKNPYQSSVDAADHFSYAFVCRLKWRFPTPPPTPTPEGYHTPPPAFATPTPEGYHTPHPTIATPTPEEYTTPTPPTIPTPTPLRPIIDSGDYNGDGTSDIAIFREGSGLWAVRRITRVYFGGSSDIPISGDYNDDGTSDIGIFRPVSGLWAVRGVTRSYFGSSSDTAVPGDYNGDGYCDIGIFRDSSGLWAVRGVTRTYFGTVSDRPATGDYNGDGTKGIALFRGSSGLWALRGISRIYFGSSSDESVPGDFNGNGAWETGIFRPSSGLWAIRGVTRAYFGSSSDWPVPADYNGIGSDSIGIFREGSGLWAIQGVTRVYFGSNSDIPVTR